MTKVMLFFVSAVFHQAHKAIENTGVLTPLAANTQRVASIFGKGKRTEDHCCRPEAGKMNFAFSLHLYFSHAGEDGVFQILLFKRKEAAICGDLGR